MVGCQSILGKTAPHHQSIRLKIFMKMTIKSELAEHGYIAKKHPTMNKILLVPFKDSSKETIEVDPGETRSGSAEETFDILLSKIYRA